MRSYESILDDLRESMREGPGAGLRGRIIESAGAKAADVPPARRKIGMRTALLAALLAVLVMTTAFTCGKEVVGAIREFMFGESNMVRVREIDDGAAVGSLQLVGGGDYPAPVETGETADGYYASIEEANRFAPFIVKAPRYLPEDVSGLHSVFLGYYGEEAGYIARVTYRAELPSGNTHISIAQYYEGPGAHGELETIYPAEKVMVGDAEASLVRVDQGFYDHDWLGAIAAAARGDAEEALFRAELWADERRAEYRLYWMKDDVLYEYHNDWYDLETMLAIAASI